MNSLTINDGLVILGIIVALFIGIAQIMKRSTTSNYNQTQGMFSKGEQKINITSTRPDND